MRKPRDFDAEMKALTDRARLLKSRKLYQLGELVIATGADAMPVEQLAGALLAAKATKNAADLEGWRERGAAFFRRTTRNEAGEAGPGAGGESTGESGRASAAGEAGT